MAAIDEWDPFRLPPSELKDGRYHLHDKIGAGAVAQVWSATDRRRNQRCAIKLMEIPVGKRTEVAMRFIAEAQAMGRLRHPNVPHAYDIGEEQGFYWFVMELAPGGSLAERIAEEGPFEPLEAMRITFEILQALAAVHRAGIVHRDIKPDNVLLDEQDRALLCDFGIARHGEGRAHQLTTPGSLLGTRGFRAPEQEEDSSRVVPTSDLYGVAATLYTMIVGEPPNKLWFACREASLPGTVPALAFTVIAGGAAEDPEERFEDARAMAKDVALVYDMMARRANRPVRGEEWMARFDQLLEEVEKAPPAQASWIGRWLPGWAARLLGGA